MGSSAQGGARRLKVAHSDHPHYRWIALSNTTLGVLLATINSTIILIALPAIFRGIGVDPLAPGETSVMLWMLMGYMVVTAVLVVTAGRISDMFGRVRLYNLGFAVFTLGSVLLFLTPGSGNTAALLMIVFRIVQGIGGAFLFANSAAILTDAFPAQQRGLALGLNQIAGIAGSLLGLLLGGLLAAVDWRVVFLVSVPIGVIGTVWAYIALHETARIRKGQRLDIWGNVLFGAGLIVLLLGITYALLPYGTDSMGWGNPWVIACLAGGPLLLVAFGIVETRVPDPMVQLSLFKNRAFALANVANFLGSVARGGLQFMLIIWLQGIWLPLHGYDFADTPLWAGIYMMPLMVGFLIAGPVSGWLTDRLGARMFSTAGMLITGVAFILLTFLPANFSFPVFALLIGVMGLGMGFFSAPNTTAVMNAVPPQHRGVASGVRATLQNAGMMLSMGLFFTMVVVGLAADLPATLSHGLTQAGLPGPEAAQISHLPPTAALFAAFLGYNPMGNLLPHSVLSQLPAATQHTLLGNQFFPNLVSPAFITGLHLAFYLAAAISLVAAVASALIGKRYVYDEAVLPPVNEGTEEIAVA